MACLAIISEAGPPIRMAPRRYGAIPGMNHEQLFLRPNVVAEPLVDGWYAWAHLIPPATAARNLTERHLKIMESYIESPETHEAAVRNPALLGGPFMDFDRNRVEDVRRLRDRTLKET